MFRPFVTACAAVAFVMLILPQTARASHTPDIACRVLLPEAPIPGDPGHLISIQEVTVAGGHDGHRHLHDSVEYLHVISGSGTLVIEGQPDTPLAPGTVVTIPARTPHQARNASETAPLVFIATFVETDNDHTVTAYVGEADTVHGCPHPHGTK
jgi:quercetin dioxygenase-like cupin family protein